jgi:hypothetical protein
MILDERLELGDDLALTTATTAAYLLGDVIDLGGDGLDGNSEDIYLNIEVTSAITSTGAATVQFALCSDAQAAISVDGTQTTHFQTVAIPKATLVAGYQIASVQLPRGVYERYLGAVVTTGTAPLSGGKVNAYLTQTPRAWKATPDAI